MIERITELKAELLYIDSHKNILKEETMKLNQLSLELKEKEKVLLKENKDVEELEKMSFKSIFYSILGNKDKQLESEKYEAIQASLEYQRVLYNYNIKKEEVNKLEIRINNEENIVQELEDLQLKVNIDNKDIIKYRDQITKIQSQLKEINEAIETGEIAKEALETVRLFLNKADGWSTVDVLGGNFLSDIIKRENLQKAQEHLQLSQNKIEKFERELKDVTLEKVVIPVFDEFDYILDVVFDNIFTDWSIKNKISQSLQQVNNTVSCIEKVLDDLYKDRQDNVLKININKKELKEMLKKL
ncbi:MAG: hypothetical protein U0L85_03370 [Bacilli bacterium]|nr:hypothetical protein [Bacilli bacterium]